MSKMTPRTKYIIAFICAIVMCTAAITANSIYQSRLLASFFALLTIVCLMVSLYYNRVRW